ncbi:MAG: alpha/beta hydrolase [Anaerolineaceae bacterium]|nr:alpha/beta hydrolase [Anaerolineaceae bacterium]
MRHLADLTDEKSASFYADVPAGDMKKFQAFCREFPYRQLVHAGIEWPYLDNARKGEALLMLSGALSIPDISWLSITHFGQAYHVIVPSYPAVHSMNDLVDGIAAILKHEGVKKAHVMGGSYGGFVAQVFVRRHPQLCRSLVLSHTFAPDPANAGSAHKMARWMKWLPEGILRWLMGRMLGKMMPPHDDRMVLMLGHFKELLYHRLTKVDMLGTVLRWGDYYARVFTPADLKGWPGRVLLVLADDDPGTPEAERAKLSALYPAARVHLFHGTGHVTSVLKEQEYQAVIDGFLRSNFKEIS